MLASVCAVRERCHMSARRNGYCVIATEKVLGFRDYN